MPMAQDSGQPGMDRRSVTGLKGFVAQGMDAIIAKVHDLDDMFG
jgi:hypothetical protein